MRAFLLFLVSAAGVGGAAANGINVVFKTLELEQEYTLQVSSSIEYILQFNPSPEHRAYPIRLWVAGDAAVGDATHPLLLTVRQRTGALIWQLPYYVGDTLLYELERTLCADDSLAGDDSDCAAEGAGGAGGAGAGFSLHVSSWRGAGALRVRAGPAPAGRLPAGGALRASASLWSPHVARFEWPAGVSAARLVASSPDAVCATLAVHNYTCPIAQTFDEVQLSPLRMTMLGSGAAHLSKVNFPRGFYVIALIPDTDQPCLNEEDEEGGEQWLLEAALGEGGRNDSRATGARVKALSYEIRPALSRSQYVVGGVVTLAVFLLFYVLFGVLVLAERWPRWYNLVAPRAVLADVQAAETGAAQTAPSRRRDSTATFDGSDASDTDSEDDDTRAATRDTPADTRAMAPGVVTPGTISVARTAETSPGDTSTTAQRTPDAATREDTLSMSIATPNKTSSGAKSTGDVLNGSGAPPPAPPPGPGSPGVTSPGVPRASGVTVDTPGEHIDAVQLRDEGDGTTRDTRSPRPPSAPRPFGLPARLHVAALARRRGRVLRARSRRYLHTLYTVAVFYALPVVQFVVAFQVVLNVSGSLDLCYYNFLCAHPVGALSDFNHVFSNLGYLALGALYMLQVRRRRLRRKRHPRHEEYGIPPHYGLSSSLGAGMMMVALLSATYHICPNRLNFQFDTAFMYVLAVLSMVKVYQSRHPDINARAHATFGVLAVLIALVVWGVLGGGPLFWSVFTVLHVFTFLVLSLRIYYVGQFRLEKESLAVAAQALRARGSTRPLYVPRLVALLLANGVNWAFAIYGLVTQSANIASHLLFVLLCNALLHIVFYLCMKLLHGERVRWYCWLHLALAAAAWAPALYFFTSGSTDWSASPAQSRQLNHECRVLALYDSHDLWHMLSAAALYFTFNAMLTWDDTLSAVRRTEIAVF